MPERHPRAATRFQIDSCAPQLAAARDGKIRLHALAHGRYPGVRLKPAQIPGVSSVGFWDGVGAQDWGLDQHRNEGVEICFLETGTMAFCVGAKNFALRPGHLTITRPWQLHKLGAPNIGPGRLHWLILDVGVRRPSQDWRWPGWLTLTRADRTQLTRKLRRGDNAVWQASPAIASVFRGLSNCIVEWQKPHAESRMIALLNQILLEVLTMLTEQKSSKNPGSAARRHTVRLFLRELAENAASSGALWSLETMAAHCGMGVTAFSKYCREQTNSGPVEYLNHCRLDQAAHQLKACPPLPVTEIAFQVGFNSSQYFATVFRRGFGMSPREYRSGGVGGRSLSALEREQGVGTRSNPDMQEAKMARGTTGRTPAAGRTASRPRPKVGQSGRRGRRQLRDQLRGRLRGGRKRLGRGICTYRRRDPPDVAADFGRDEHDRQLRGHRRDRHTTGRMGEGFARERGLRALQPADDCPTGPGQRHQYLLRQSGHIAHRFDQGALRIGGDPLSEGVGRHPDLVGQRSGDGWHGWGGRRAHGHQRHGSLWSELVHGHHQGNQQGWGRL